MAKKENVASVLAFEKKLVSSDGYFYSTTWDKRTESTQELRLQEKSVRGTQSHRMKKVTDKDIAKLNQNIASPNPQTVDACSLPPEHDTLKLHFTLKVLGGISQPSACNNALFQQSYATAAKSYIEKESFRELACRYALNIANGRYLWRNRVGAEHIEVIVKQLNGDKKQWKFDATQYTTKHFDVDDSDVNDLAAHIARALASDEDFLMLDICCYAKVGNAQEVYPSEELVLDKGKGNKSKILYSVNEIAAMHSQKLGNALRTIDTWYADFNDPEQSAGTIAIEPYGAVTNLGKAFRTPKDKQDFYSLFDNWARGEKLTRIEDEHYVMAVLVRGGVFGEGES